MSRKYALGFAPVALLGIVFLVASLISITAVTNNPVKQQVTQILANVQPLECFPPGTKITLADGNRINIEDIKAGDKVLSQDSKGNKSSSTVQNLLQLGSYNMCDINFTDKESLKVTNPHPLYTQGGWKAIDVTAAVYHNPGLPISQLMVGDFVAKEDGAWKQISSISCTQGDFKVYNLTTDNNHDFFAEGFLAHNKGGVTYDKTTGERIVRETAVKDTTGKAGAPAPAPAAPAAAPATGDSLVPGVKSCDDRGTPCGGYTSLAQIINPDAALNRTGYNCSKGGCAPGVGEDLVEVSGFYKAPNGNYYPVDHSAGGPSAADLSYIRENAAKIEEATKAEDARLASQLANQNASNAQQSQPAAQPAAPAAPAAPIGPTKTETITSLEKTDQGFIRTYSTLTRDTGNGNKVVSSKSISIISSTNYAIKKADQFANYVQWVHEVTTIDRDADTGRVINAKTVTYPLTADEVQKTNLAAVVNPDIATVDDYKAVVTRKASVAQTVKVLSQCGKYCTNNMTDLERFALALLEQAQTTGNQQAYADAKQIYVTNHGTLSNEPKIVILKTPGTILKPTTYAEYSIDLNGNPHKLRDIPVSIDPPFTTLEKTDAGFIQDVTTIVRSTDASKQIVDAYTQTTTPVAGQKSTVTITAGIPDVATYNKNQATSETTNRSATLVGTAVNPLFKTDFYQITDDTGKSSTYKLYYTPGGQYSQLLTYIFNGFRNPSTSLFIPPTSPAQAPVSQSSGSTSQAVTNPGVPAGQVAKQAPTLSESANSAAGQAASNPPQFGITISGYTVGQTNVSPQLLQQLYNNYYNPSPAAFLASGTLYGDQGVAIATIEQYRSYMLDQMSKGFVLEASGQYGYHPELLSELQNFHFLYQNSSYDHNNVLLQNEASPLYSFLRDTNAVNGQFIPLTPDKLNANQKRIYNFTASSLVPIGDASQQTPEAAIKSCDGSGGCKYVGIVAAKSANDLGRSFLLYKKGASGQNKFVGLVLVGDYAKRADWTGTGATTTDEFVRFPLGVRQADGQQWGFDLTTDLYKYFGGSGGPITNIVAVDPDTLPKNLSGSVNQQTGPVIVAGVVPAAEPAAPAASTNQAIVSSAVQKMTGCVAGYGGLINACDGSYYNNKLLTAATLPNIQPTAFPNSNSIYKLYWCTQLVVDSARAAGINLQFNANDPESNIYAVQTMYDVFKSKGITFSENNLTQSNIQKMVTPGMVAFINTPSNQGTFDHVGIVKDVNVVNGIDQNGVQSTKVNVNIIQSNSGTVQATYVLTGNGKLKYTNSDGSYDLFAFADLSKYGQ